MPPHLYRGFTAAAHAEAFCRGEILLSTLHRCRNFESEAARSHPNEAWPTFLAANPMEIPEAYLLTFTNELLVAKEEFGGFVVEVTEPKVFMEEIALALERRGFECQAHFGYVTYATQEHLVTNTPAVEIAFTKPEIFHWEQEFRMIWEPIESTVPLQRRLLKCSSAGHLCKLLR